MQLNLRVSTKENKKGKEVIVAQKSDLCARNPKIPACVEVFPATPFEEQNVF